MVNNILSGFYNEAFEKYWDRPVFSDYEGEDFTYGDVAKKIKSLHLFYQLIGLKKGDKIAVLGRNSANWGIVFLSTLSSGIVVVPVLPDFNKSNTNHIINHSEAKLVIGANSLLSKIELEKADMLKAVLKIEDFSVFEAKEKDCKYKLNDAFNYYKENELRKENFKFYDWKEEETCLLSYTSGTSGFTKGVMISAKSMVSNIVYARDHMPLKAGHEIVSFLPLAHVYGLLFEFLFPVTLGCHITFLSRIPSPAVVAKVFGQVKPHLILSVPLVIEKIYKKKIVPVIEKPLMKILLKIPGINNIIYNKISKKLNETFGGRFYEIVVGGAAINTEVEKFFKKINFRITVGYGMTECGPLIGYETWNKSLPTSAGRLVDRMQIRIDSDDPYNKVGEIQVKGQNVMTGYYKNEQATKEAFTDDGWLKTGDLGIIDENNFIFIKGRSKNMILGPSGQNIYPEEIEARICNLLYMGECVVTERNGKLIAKVYPDYESMKTDGVEVDELEEIIEDNRKILNAELPKYERIAAFELMGEEFEKTPKRNIRRYKYV